MPPRRLFELPFAAVVMTAVGLCLAACGGSAGGRVTVASAARRARWKVTSHIHRVLDVSATRRPGGLVVEAAGQLALLGVSGELQAFARGPAGYRSPGGEEPYIALSAGQRVPRARCAFDPDATFVLRLARGPGVTTVDSRGGARRFATLPGSGLENGIAFDTTGRFGHRLLVSSTSGSQTTVYAIDCHGAVTTVTRDAPKLEGGIAVAPASFGRFGGELIAPDENSGRIYAIAPDGDTRLLAASGLPHGGDVGIESVGFVPTHFGAGWSAFVADRLTPGNPHPGDDAVLGIDAASLASAGVVPGDLLVATEGGARTDDITCGSSCRVRHVADGPSAAHLEDHIAFVAGT